MVKLGNLSLSLRSLSLDHETEDGDTIASINKYLEDNIEEYRRFRQLGQSETKRGGLKLEAAKRGPKPTGKLGLAKAGFSKNER